MRLRRRAPYTGPDAHLRVRPIRPTRRERVRRVRVALAGRWRSAAAIVSDAIALVLMTYGTWLIYAPAGYLLAGLFFLAIAWAIDRPAGPGR